MAASPATESGSTGFLGREATVYQCPGSATAVRSALSLTSLMPCQKEPNTRQGILFSSMNRLGSMAFQRSRPVTDCISFSWSTYLKSLVVLSIVLLVESPIQVVFLP